MIRALCLLCILAAPVAAQTDPARLADRAARLLDDAAQESRAANTARDRVAALTDTVQAYEVGLEASHESLRRAAEHESRIVAQLESQHARLVQLVGTLQTMGSTPEGLFLMHPSGPVDTARARMLMRDVTPAMLAGVGDLRADLHRTATLRALQSTVQSDLAAGLQGVQQARGALSQAVSDRDDLPDRAAADDAPMTLFAQSVDTLHAFAARLPDADHDAPNGANARCMPDLAVIGAVALPSNGTDAMDIRG